MLVIIDGVRRRINAARAKDRITGPGVRDLVMRLGHGGGMKNFDIEDGADVLNSCRLTDIRDDASIGHIVWIRSVLARPDLWDAAKSALLANGAEPDDMTMGFLRLARDGHENRVALVRSLLDDVTGCTCGADDLCVASEDTPERIAARAALAALLAHVIGED